MSDEVDTPGSCPPNPHEQALLALEDCIHLLLRAVELLRQPTDDRNRAAHRVELPARDRTTPNSKEALRRFTLLLARQRERPASPKKKSPASKPPSGKI